MAIAAVEEDIREAAFDCWEAKSGQLEQIDHPKIDDFERLYLTYRSRVWSLCLRMTANRDEAEDLTQETFLRLFQKLETFRGESAFYTWLRRLTINVVLLRFQSARWRRETSLEELTEPDPVTGCPHKREFGGIDTHLLGVVDRINLQRALDQLPPGLKAVFILHDLEGYEHVEISELMGCSIGTSKSQLHKARLKMREFLQKAPCGFSAYPRQGAGGTPPATTARNQLVLPFTRLAPQGHTVSAPVAA